MTNKISIAPKPWQTKNNTPDMVTITARKQQKNERILNLIRETGPHQVISYTDMSEELGIPYGTMYNAITELMEQGKIGRRNTSDTKTAYVYYILDEARDDTATPIAEVDETPDVIAEEQDMPTETKEEVVAEPTAAMSSAVDPQPKQPIVAPIFIAPGLALTAEQLAKDFYWQTQSTDLREFVEWCKQSSIVEE